MAKKSFTLPDGKGTYTHKEKPSYNWQRLKHVKNTGIKQFDVAPDSQLMAPEEQWRNKLYHVDVSRFATRNFINGGGVCAYRYYAYRPVRYT